MAIDGVQVAAPQLFVTVIVFPVPVDDRLEKMLLIADADSLHPANDTVMLIPVALQEIKPALLNGVVNVVAPEQLSAGMDVNA